MRRGIVLALVALCVSACGSHASSPAPGTALSVDTRPQSLKVVAVTACAANAQRHVQISGTVKNTTSKRLSYVIQLSIRSRAGAPLFATAAEARSVSPQAIAGWTAATTARFEPGMTCVVTGIAATS